MHKKDLIVRQLEEFGKVLGLILFFKKQKDWEKFQAEIAEATQKFTALDIEQVEFIDLEQFNNEITHSETISLEQKKILAGILFEKLDYYAICGMAEKEKETAAKCLALYECIHSNQTQNEFNLEVHYRLEFLKNSRDR